VLDKINRRIIAALIEDGRASVETISEKIGLSPTPVRRRIKRMEEAGVITGYSANIDPRACGLMLTLYTYISLRSLDPGLIAEFERRVREIPEVQRCELVTGSYAYVMVLRLANIDKYNQYLRQVISRLPGVSATTTQVVIETIKDKLNIPLNDN